MPYDYDRDNWLIVELKKSMKTFDENTTSLLEGQKKSFESCCELLREDDDLSSGSKSRRSVRQRARKFLKGIYQSIGPEVFLLCTLGPSITRLGENALRIRLSTIEAWWCSALKPQGLKTVATELCQAKTVLSLVQSKGHDTSGLPGRRPSEYPALPATKRNREIESDGETQNTQGHKRQKVLTIPPTDSNLPTVQEQQILEHASLRGVVEVFDAYMCNAIRRVSVDGESKAAITMIFPGWGGPVDCLMSLDVCQWGIAQLSMALFNAKVEWTEYVLHVILENGTTLTTETSEVTLKGVEDKIINKVFGSEIYHAIAKCAVRRSEMAEGRNVTECVSMTLTQNGAIINLSLGLEGGLRIENKLYT